MIANTHPSRGRKPSDTSCKCHRACARCSDGRAFSLIEMMIAIVILGLGLVMVATMFPVAWDRARTLSEHTTEQTIASAAHARMEATLRPAGIKLVPIDPPPILPPYEIATIAPTSFAGDLLFDQSLARRLLSVPVATDEAYQGIIPAFCDTPLLFFSDTRVHALNMENLTADDLTETEEDPWELEWVFNLIGAAGSVHPCDPGGAAGWAPSLSIDFVNQSFFRPQVRIKDRVYPTLEDRPDDAPSHAEARNAWNDRFLNRKYSFAVLHRLRERVGPEAPPDPAAVTPTDSKDLVDRANAAIGSTREFDMYYVSLRRAQSTHRYAVQDHDNRSNAFPNPFVLDAGEPAAVPRALPDTPSEPHDVLLPVAWRIQVQFPNTLAWRNQPPGGSALPQPTGIPTEVTIPADPASVTGDSSALVVSAFPGGTTFVDEISGTIYRVVKRRVLLDTTGANQRAVLTLDREVVLDDIDLPAGDRRCAACQPVSLKSPPGPDDEELRRTVWVFPPPVNRTDRDNPVFEGASPVIGIQVHTLSVAPPS